MSIIALVALSGKTAKNKLVKYVFHVGNSASGLSKARAEAPRLDGRRGGGFVKPGAQRHRVFKRDGVRPPSRTSQHRRLRCSIWKGQELRLRLLTATDRPEAAKLFRPLSRTSRQVRTSGLHAETAAS